MIGKVLVSKDVVAIAVLLFGAAVASCGPPEASPSRMAGERFTTRAINWEKPLLGGLTVTRVEEAQTHVSFEIRMPRFSTKPVRIMVDSPSVVQKTSDRIVAFVYEFEDSGIVLVKQRQALLDAEDFVQMDQNPAYEPDEFQMVSIGESPGLLISNGVLGRVIWSVGDVQLDVSGPSLSPDDARRLANSL